MTNKEVYKVEDCEGLCKLSNRKCDDECLLKEERKDDDEREKNKN